MVQSEDLPSSAPENPASPDTDLDARIRAVLEPLPSLSQYDSPDDVITQAELERYLELVEASRQQSAMRMSIVERLERGVPVEPGELEPRIDIETQLTCSWKRLEEVLGKWETGRIRRRVAETEYRRLRIYDSQGNILGWGEKRQSG